MDFAHSGGEGQYAVFESLHEPADLAEWLARSPLDVVVPVTPRDFTAAKKLRQAIWETAQAQAARQALPIDAVTTINRFAAVAPLVPQLAADGTAAAWAAPVRTSQVLSTLAREMISLLSGPYAERIRVCASDNCPLVFVDLSRPGARRWCSMERCGNRSKLRAHRARQA
ncbi:CGNR zinc finger domain-containing protein [Cryptosporangium minutisporangium]|uniref:CGNR zinc finger domain-containing protein n=1 Tax=Cryptosporangium minutisporangium TaxID=113569 RepID=A0ABP6SRF2_9ACTN